MFKKFIRQFVCFSAIFLATVQGFASDHQVEPQWEIVELAQKFDQHGVLKQKDNGYLYLDVSNDFVIKILPLIQAQGKIVPPHHVTSKKGIGAHISVMYENEQILNEIWEIKELGQVYSFCVKELRTVKINRNNEMKKLWLLAVEAPELEQLRMDYGLEPKLKGHDFHISLGNQIPGKREKILFIPLMEEEVEQCPEAA